MATITWSEQATAAEHVYTELTRFFRDYSSSVVEFDILPSSYPLPDAKSLVLQDGPNLAIRKRDLVGAFVVARKLFLANQSHVEDLERGVEDLDRVRGATSVLLFFDPEHLTAVNWRKRYIRRLMIHETLSPPAPILNASDAHARRVVLKQELTFLTSLLTSPLRRHTKSPTLWYHRLWLIKNYCATVTDVSKQELWKEEHQVALQAGHRHFSNYYAFDYLRKLAAVLAREVENSISYHSVLVEVQTWCLAHPRDISGFSYFAYLLQRGQPLPSHLMSDILDAVTTFAEKFSKQGQSIIHFQHVLRTLLRGGA
jgi:hypothetical protein